MPAKLFYCPVTLRAIASVNEMRAHDNLIACPACGDVHSLDPEFISDAPSSPCATPTDDVNEFEYRTDRRADPRTTYSHDNRISGHHVWL
jgi:hypothetical protein